MRSSFLPSIIKRMKGGPDINRAYSGWSNEQDNKQLCKGLESFFTNVNRLGFCLQRLQNALGCTRRGGI
jgi:hypothetical protein